MAKAEDNIMYVLIGVILFIIFIFVGFIISVILTFTKSKLFLIPTILLGFVCWVIYLMFTRGTSYEG